MPIIYGGTYRASFGMAVSYLAVVSTLYCPATLSIETENGRLVKRLIRRLSCQLLLLCGKFMTQILQHSPPICDRIAAHIYIDLLTNQFTFTTLVTRCSKHLKKRKTRHVRSGFFIPRCSMLGGLFRKDWRSFFLTVLTPSALWHKSNKQKGVSHD